MVLRTSSASRHPEPSENIAPPRPSETTRSTALEIGRGRLGRLARFWPAMCRVARSGGSADMLGLWTRRGLWHRFESSTATSRPDITYLPIVFRTRRCGQWSASMNTIGRIPAVAIWSAPTGGSGRSHRTQRYTTATSRRDPFRLSMKLAWPIESTTNSSPHGWWQKRNDELRQSPT